MAGDLLDMLATHLQATERRDNRYHCDCPFCHKEEKAAQKHFSFCDKGYKCWVCQAAGNLRDLAIHLRCDTENMPRANRQPKQKQERPLQGSWRQAPQKYLERYCGHFERIQRWQAYKPLTLDTIATFRLGVGKLRLYNEKDRYWYNQRHERLIVPVFAADGTTVVGFFGRAIHPDDTGPKWLAASDSSKQVLFNAHLLRAGATVIIAENYVDATLATQYREQVVGVTSGGVHWRPEWTKQIVDSRPARVIVWLDNDLVGWPHPSTQRRLARQWKIDHPEAQVPEANGPKIADELLMAGLRQVAGPHWEASDPPKADLGWFLNREFEQAGVRI